MYLLDVFACFRCLPHPFFRDAHPGGCTPLPDRAGPRTTYATGRPGRLEHDTPLVRWYRDRVVYSYVFRRALLQRDYHLVLLLPLQFARGKQRSRSTPIYQPMR